MSEKEILLLSSSRNSARIHLLLGQDQDREALGVRSKVKNFPVGIRLPPYVSLSEVLRGSSLWW